MSFTSHFFLRLSDCRFIAAVVAFTFLTAAFSGSSAHADLWTGGTGGTGTAFEDGANWDTGNAPATGNNFQAIDGVFTVDRAVGINAARTFVYGGATLNVISGTHNDSRSGGTIRNFVGTSGDGTVNQSGGVYQIGHLLLVGNNGGNTGIYNLTGGDLSIYRGGNTFMGVAGGSSLEIGTNGGSGSFIVSGGTLETRIGVGVGGGGVFEVIGTTPGSIAIGGNGSLDGSWTQAAGGILRTGIDATGVTPVDVQITTGTGSGGGNATFAAGSILDPYDLGGAATNTWTTVLSWDGALSGTPTLSAAAAAAGWTQRVDGMDLQVCLDCVPVPEPSSLTLLGLAGLAGLLVRRKK